MRGVDSHKQGGYVLLLTLLSFMVIGGVVAASFTQDARKGVEKSRYEHNQRVLNEAKQALLKYTYNYPRFTGITEGPGRLPCPDSDNDGLPGPADAVTCRAVGRFPWAQDRMNFYDARDADGERLWYAVSDNFFNLGGGPPQVNSDSAGTITLYSQNGSVLYDGSRAGVAAVIIAPGEILPRDEDNNGTYEYTQVRATAAQQLDPRNYLDAMGDLAEPVGFDNAVFNNSQNNSNDDGFIQGPVTDPATNTFVVNDQFVVVTVEEVMEMAQQSVIQTYKDAIDEYQLNIGENRYPWLEPYDSDANLNTVDAVVTPAANPVIGRLPSIFKDYFIGPDPGNSQSIDPELRLSITVDGETYNLSIPANGVAATRFDAAGDLVTQIANGAIIRRFFWDGHKNGNEHVNSPADGIWEMCPLIDQIAPNVAHEDDCNRTTAGTFIGVSEADTGNPESSDVWLEVRYVEITFFSATPTLEFEFLDRTGAAVEFWQSSIENPDPQNHVYIAAEYDDPFYISNFTWDEDEEFLAGHGTFPAGNFGNHNYDAGDSITAGLPYYPILPTWVISNGWHDMMQVAYSPILAPGGAGGTCGVGVNCLTVRDIGGIDNNKNALLLLSGNERDGDETLPRLVDGNLGAAGGPLFLVDDLGLIFEGENAGPLDLIFEKRGPNSNDIVFLLE